VPRNAALISATQPPYLWVASIEKRNCYRKKRSRPLDGWLMAAFGDDRQPGDRLLDRSGTAGRGGPHIPAGGSNTDGSSANQYSYDSGN
jgi:hypothetical protein